ncbi:MAG: hypothetical protein JEY91_10295, partial [Spirochaetaceae bacterium]|nr:hypothetical protein [Spirochaetaceae bacterium]
MKRDLRKIFTLLLSISILLAFSCKMRGPYDFSLNLATSTGSGSIDTAASTATGVYEDGTSVTAKAIVDPGSVFAGWYTEPVGGEDNVKLSGENPYTFNIDDHSNLYASFVKRATN